MNCAITTFAMSHVSNVEKKITGGFSQKSEAKLGKYYGSVKQISLNQEKAFHES